jgi:hypothetical protein
VGRFLAGFITASVLWGAGAALFFTGMLGSDEGADDTTLALGPELDAGVSDEPTQRRSKGRGRRGGDRSGAASVPQGNATTGDDLGELERQLDLGSEGGEAQLSSRQIGEAMDSAFGRIRRCLILAAGDDPVTGRLVFGLRIEPTGRVSRVNLSGPAAVSTGDAGDCLRAAAQGVQFPAFDGPPMITRYPVTLD